jgi:hypothetical protein
MTSILARHHRLLRDETFVMTRAQQTAVDAIVLTHENTRLMPDEVLAIAAEAGFPVALKPAPPGLAAALVRHLKG